MITGTKISILITTKNRLSDLKYTLEQLEPLLKIEDIECYIYDDGSTDGTSSFVCQHYPNVKFFKNDVSKGYIYNRNYLLNNCSGAYAISLDDDAHFLSSDIIENIIGYFQSHPKCGVIACRIFWGKILPVSLKTNERAERVKAFVGCGHVWNLKAWREIPSYPEWFVFYGEEEFASYQLYKKGWEVHYVPEILVHHRVEVKSRKKDADYVQRQRRSFRSGWYLYLLFYPIQLIPRKLIYTFVMQLKNKTLKGDFKATLGVLLGVLDVFRNFSNLIKSKNRLSREEYSKFQDLTATKIYWKPNEE